MKGNPALAVLYNKTATVREDAQLDGRLQEIAREIAALGAVWE